MSKIKDVKAALASAIAEYNDVVHTASANDVRAASDKIRELRAELASTITEGANPCPDCGNAPHGIEQPGRRGTSEYEVGCLVCGNFEHTDGTIRQHRVRGGMLPQHAVDAWNEGPDAWLVAPPDAPLARPREAASAPESRDPETRPS
jgi:hypothetical protein